MPRMGAPGWASCVGSAYASLGTFGNARMRRLIGSDRPGPVLEADGVICMQVTSYADKSPPTFSPNCALGQPNACCATAGGDGCYR